MDEYDGRQFVGIDLHRQRSVIVTPNSTVRMIVSATTAAGNDVGSDTGLPG